MGTRIKTRQTRKYIKVLDKTITTAERVRQSHVRAKGEMAQTQEHADPVEYAEDRVVGGTDAAVHKGVHHAGVQGGRLAGAAKQRYRKAKEIKQRKAEIQREQAGISTEGGQPASASGGGIQSQPGEQMKRQVQNQAAKERAHQRVQREGGQKMSGQISQGADASSKAMKGTVQRKNGMKPARQAGQKSIKNRGKSVKTGRRTAKTTVKTTEQAAKQAYRTAKASRETAGKAAQGAKQSAKAAKKAAKASARAARAVIAATKILVSALVSFGWIAVFVLIIVILFGGFLCMTGGDNAATVSPVSAEVRVFWCACFVSWCGEQCGYLENGVMPKFSLCSDGVKWFQDKGQFQDGSYVPAAGDIIFYDWGNDGSIDHVGIVESVKKGTVNTIEGNSGDAVRKRSYPVGDSRIYGYGVLQY